MPPTKFDVPNTQPQVIALIREVTNEDSGQTICDLASSENDSRIKVVEAQHLMEE